MRTNLRLVILSCVIALAIGEGLLRWLDIGDPPAFEKDPHYGYLMQPNQSVSTRGSRFHINREGFRGVDFAWRKPEGVFRIAFAGDSITYGGGSVPETDLFVNQVASRLSSLTNNKIEAINLSAPGWGILNIAAYLKTDRLPEVDLLVWVVPAADFRRPKMSLEEYGFPTKKAWSRITYLASVATSKVYNEVYNMGRRWWFIKSNETSGEAQAVRDQNVQTLVYVLSGRMAKGNRVMVAFVPSQHGNDTDPEDLAVYRLAADSVSIPCLDLGPAFQRERFDKLFFDGMHLTSLGHKVAADAIVVFLTKQFFTGTEAKLAGEINARCQSTGEVTDASNRAK